MQMSLCSFILYFFLSASDGIQILDLKLVNQVLYHCTTEAQACQHAVLFAIFIFSASGWFQTLDLRLAN
jgi:hypothetical protein